MFRGYAKEDFGDVFSRYLPSDPPLPPPASLQSTYGKLLSATGTPKVADDEACKSNDFNSVAAVADANFAHSEEREP